MNKKLLFVLSRFPWPCDTGQKGLISYWCQIIKEQLNIDVYLFFANRSEGDTTRIPSYIDGYKFGHKISSKRKILNIISHSFFGRWPMQTSIYFDKKNAKELKVYCHEIKPDYIVYDMIRLMEYVKYTNSEAKQIMNLTDMLSSRYFKNSKSNSNASVFGESGEKGLISKLSNNRFLKKKALKFEAKKTLKAENRCLNLFDKIAFITEKEANIYNERTNSNKACFVPIGVDYDYLSKTINTYDNNNLVFLGNLTYGPNYDSVRMICEKILPLIDCDYNMTFIGNCHDDLRKKYECENIKFTGRVDDFRTIIGNSIIFLAPISYGTGIKTKIIEAMGMGKCVVTNSVGAENIDAQNASDLYIIDDYNEIANKVKFLLSDRSNISLIGNNAQKCVLEKYTYVKTKDSLESLILY